MTHTGRYHGGLVFLGKNEIELDSFCRIAAATLQDYGHCVERQSVQADVNGRITASRFSVHIALSKSRVEDSFQRGSRYRNMFDDTAFEDAQNIRLSLSLQPADPVNAPVDECELLLVVMLFRMVEAHRPDTVEWLDPDMQIETQAFLRAFENVSPRRVRGRQEILPRSGERFGPIDEMESKIHGRAETLTGSDPRRIEEGPVTLSDEEKLAWALRTEPHPDEYDFDSDVPSDVQRLATWAVTGVLATVSAPVALSVAAVNLARGEDFRLNTQALSLTAGLVGLQSSGMLERAMSLFTI